MSCAGVTRSTAPTRERDAGVEVPARRVPAGQATPVTDPVIYE
ncbi:MULTISPECIES: hypothetical protein [unclassified Frankia]|nr:MULTISPECIES: hypothetical protein [unclassified Frankia]